MHDILSRVACPSRLASCILPDHFPSACVFISLISTAHSDEVKLQPNHFENLVPSYFPINTGELHEEPLSVAMPPKRTLFCVTCAGVSLYAVFSDAYHVLTHTTILITFRFQ